MAASESFVEMLRGISIRFSGLKKCGSRQILESRMGSDGVHAVIYQRELVKCGKKRCECSAPRGRLHGPYWYAYWKSGGRTRKKYIGKKFRELAPVSVRLVANDELDRLVDELVAAPQGKRKK